STASGPCTDPVHSETAQVPEQRVQGPQGRARRSFTVVTNEGAPSQIVMRVLGKGDLDLHQLVHVGVECLDVLIDRVLGGPAGDVVQEGGQIHLDHIDGALHKLR